MGITVQYQLGFSHVAKLPTKAGSTEKADIDTSNNSSSKFRITILRIRTYRLTPFTGYVGSP